MTTTPLDKEVLQEIVRIVQTKRAVPKTIEVGGKRYVLTYLDDHRERMVDALANHDANMLNILFGQLASKVKYQAVPLPSAEVAATKFKGAGKEAPAKPHDKRRTASPPTAARRRSKPRRELVGAPAKQKSTKKSVTRSSQASSRRRLKRKK